MRIASSPAISSGIRAVRLLRRRIYSTERLLLLFVLVYCFAADETAAYPLNDDCLDAEMLAGQGTVAFDLRDASTDSVTDLSCPQVVFNTDAHIANDVWYCWSAPHSGTVTIDACGSTTVDTKLAVYPSCTCPPDPSLLLSCDNDTCIYQSTTTFIALTGESYLIQLGTAPVSDVAALDGGPGILTIAYGEAPAPSCTMAEVDCQPSDSWDVALSDGVTVKAADDFSVSAPGSVDRICWWGAYADEINDCSATDSFVVRYFDDDGGYPGSVLGVFSQAEGTLSVVGPDRTFRILPSGLREQEYSATHAELSLVPGTCYWIEITNDTNAPCRWHWAVGRTQRGRSLVDGRPAGSPDGYDLADTEAFDFALCMNLPLSRLSCAPTPPNDDCSFVASITDGITYFDTSAATTDGVVPTSCMFPLGDEQIHRDVWFSYQATCTGQLRIDTCASRFDSKLAVYSLPPGECPTASTEPVACNDNQCGLNQPVQSIVTLPIVQDQPLLIRVGGYASDWNPEDLPGDSGSGVLAIRCGPVPEADRCSNAAIQTLPNVWSGSTVGATSSCSEFSGGDVWVAFSLSTTSSVILDLVAPGGDLGDAWRGVTPICNCETFTFANHEELVGVDTLRLTWNCLTPGTYRYPVVVDPWDEGHFEVVAAAAPCQPVCQEGTEDCCEAHSSPGCASFTCCDRVCQVDEFCCTNEWDSLCAETASAACASCPENACAPSSGDCETPHQSPGCADLPTCFAVCACKPSCCTMEWTVECAQCGIADFDCSGLTRRRDHRYFWHCFGGPCTSPPCSLPLELSSPPVILCCPLGDADSDNDIDLVDFSVLQNLYAGH